MSSPSPITEPPAGRTRAQLRDGVHVFTGLPYGRADRFRAPQRLNPWEGVRGDAWRSTRAVQNPAGAPPAGDLVNYFAGCALEERDRIEEVDSEDCLVLHIATPAPDDSTRPVMVYIHGGAFDDGSGVPATWSTRLVLEEDIVLVGINHRLNAFGFLDLEAIDEAFTDAGNAGMLDLVLAMEWIRDNIASFGGDPDNVTIFGESGGGMKIGTLLAMPAAVGLFHKAIIQSGSRPSMPSRDFTRSIAERVLSGLDVTSEQLTGVPASALYDAWRRLGVRTSPVIDGRHLLRDPYAPDAPATAASVPLLIGNTLDEHSLFVAGASEEAVRAMIPLDPDTASRVEHVYEATFPHLPSRERAVRMLSAITFGNAALTQAERKSDQLAPVYRYLFTREPAVMGGYLGSFHTAELPLAMRNVRLPELEDLSRTIGAAWAAFARTGDPSTSRLAWPRFTREDRLTAVFGDEVAVVSDPFSDTQQAWEAAGATDASRDVITL